MTIIRSIGYVQLYFGIFLIIAGIFFSFTITGDYSERLNYDATYIPSEAMKYGIAENSVEYKLLLDNYRIEYENNRMSWIIGMAVDTILMILFLLFGIFFLTEGISKTRMGKAHEVHPLRKLVNNILLACIVSIVAVFFFAMLV